MVSPARALRIRLADLLASAGPGEPTLCEGWLTRDLAAHLVLREQRPDAAVGLAVPPLSGYGERVRRSYRDRDYGQLVAAFRSGPPRLSLFAVPGADQLANPLEFYIHGEDVRRASGGGPEELDPGVTRALWSRLRVLGWLQGRRAPVPFRLTDGVRDVQVGSGAPRVTVTGPLGELVLLLAGRGRVAEVSLEGAPADVQAVRDARFGL